ncbi:MAG: hypothetical protein K2R98_05565 [Gemmataceae bacterium]|nr:hypothetical protein [Gemmataceae bacterium]
MARNRFDQASRYAAKLDPAGFIAWLLGGLPLPFVSWMDTRTLPFPGDADRRRLRWSGPGLRGGRRPPITLERSTQGVEHD